MPPATVAAHPWHDLPIAEQKDFPNILHAVIEIPRGSKVWPQNLSIIAFHLTRDLIVLGWCVFGSVRGRFFGHRQSHPLWYHTLVASLAYVLCYCCCCYLRITYGWMVSQRIGFETTVDRVDCRKQAPGPYALATSAL